MKERLEELVVNKVFKDVHTDEVFRILWIDSDTTICYIIDINAKKPLPIKRSVRVIKDGFLNSDLVDEEDGFLANRLVGYTMDDKDRKIRDRAWNSIKEILSKEPEIYDRKFRGKLISDAVKRGLASDNTILKNLRKFWQRGMVINCLLPDYMNCGNKDNYEYKNKVGRPRRNGGGVNITDEIKEILKRSINKYYLSRTKPSLAYAYRMMIRDNYNDGYVYSENGKHLKLKKEEDIPTYEQYYYWFKKLYQPETVIKKRDGKTAFERNHREMLGSTEFDSLGPGSLYQIDATPADIFLLNRINTNWMVGKPILYFVVDVFSRMITGFYISLKNASWICMATALQNAFSNKQEYCKRLGINIDEDQWPVDGLPSAIIGDRGELESGFADSLVNGLGIEINNNPPYRPDWKGIIEQLFHSSHEGIRPLLPGFLHKDSGKRGSKDFRHDATLTLDDYIKVIVFFINYYNHNHYMNDYIRSSDMIKDNVRPIPIELWNWGIKTYGSLRTFDKDLVDFYLLPSDTATVTPEGIRYKKMFYSGETALKENWFSKARKKKWKVEFSYDPRNMDIIYIHSAAAGTTYIPCTLLSHQERYKGKTIEEINQLLEHEDETAKKFKHEKLENQINLLNQVEEIAKKASKRKKEEIDPSISKSKKIAEVKAKRNEEMMERDLEEAIILENVRFHEAKTPDIKEINNNLNTPSYSIIDLFNKQREKQRNE